MGHGCQDNKLLDKKYIMYYYRGMTKEASEQKLKSDILKSYDEAKSGWNSFYIESKEDHKFSMGDQWDSEDREILRKKGVPVLTLNWIKKRVDLYSGYERQNRTDLKARPIEGADEAHAEVYTKIIKWVIGNCKAEYAISDAYKDTVKGGIGWIHVYIDRERDIINGDIRIKAVSPFNMYIDPYTTQLDLSDCGYQIRYQIVNKHKLAALYPKYDDQIKKLGKPPADDIREDPEVAHDKGDNVLFLEYWYREYVKVVYSVNLKTGETEELDISFAEAKELFAEDENFTPVEKKIATIKLAILIGGEILVYDGPSPYGKYRYPYIPIFGYYDSSYHSWDLKLQGVVRALKDPQREKNKRRSMVLQSVGKSLRGGLIMDKNAVDDINDIHTSDVYGDILIKNPGKEITTITPPPMDTAVMQLEMMAGDDMNHISANPDLMGGEQGKHDATSTIMLRQKQGLITIEEVSDHLSFAKKMLGEHLIDLISEFFPREKIIRILGSDYTKMWTDLEEQVQQGQMVQEQVAQIQEDFWNTYEKASQIAKFDIVIDEMPYSATNRMAAMAQVTQAAQYKIPMPPESFIEFMDIPVATKKRWIEWQNEQMQMQQEQQAIELQLKEKEYELKVFEAQARVAASGNADKKNESTK